MNVEKSLAESDRYATGGIAKVLDGFGVIHGIKQEDNCLELTSCHDMVSNAKRPKRGEPRIELVGTSAGSLELHSSTRAGSVSKPKDEGWCNDLPISPIHNKCSIDENEVSYS